MRLKYALLAASLTTCFLGYGPARATTPEHDPCEIHRYNGMDFVVCAARPGSTNLKLAWADKEGKPYRSFSSLRRAMTAEGKHIRFAMNAGMFDEQYRPVGLYVEDGAELNAINTGTSDKQPAPNFFKQPNGVFYLSSGGAGILPTKEFRAAAPNVDFATQSGPMLVTNNEINPIFITGSSDRTRRSGVGLCADDMLIFVASEKNINFYDFATVFRDTLKCQNALFLDGGDGVGFFSPTLKRNDWSWHGGYGPMIVLFAEDP
ncbi:phosphodiester glycosidase family protein [Rhizobium sp. RM]|uniref:phosphodiester glycosidase family protein n=1 Tax=Rhizobium sp. RM TaxID=2748079 RepID=UPI00110D93E8|nr:phosphodiester glycosidase family protein [Rhizobium sp. RM]TMV21896.1 hypothetical protein BJG94_04230 [Rhizobium sp. Td3]